MSQVKSIPEEEYLQWKNLIYHVISRKFTWVFQNRRHFRGNPLGTNTVTLDDMVQAGSIGLNNAWLTFDSSRGVLFKTYAYKGISFAINAWITKERRFIRQNRRLMSALSHGNNLNRLFDGSRRRSDQPDNAPGIGSLGTGDYESSPTPIATRTVASRDRTEQDEADINMDYQVVRQKVIEIVGSDRAEILFRHTRGETFQQIADSEGVSKEAIRQRIKVIIKQVRDIWADARHLSTT